VRLREATNAQAEREVEKAREEDVNRAATMWKAVAVVRTGPVRGAAGGAAGGAARGARRAARRGRSQSSGRRARWPASACAARRQQRRRTRKRTPIDTTKHTKQGGHSKQHWR